MSSILLTLPILAGKVEAWRRFCQELSGTRLQTYIASRRRLGITYENISFVESPFGPVAVNLMEALDLNRAFLQIATSILPFDSWYRERLRDLHGIDAARYEQFAQSTLSVDGQELIFEWKLTP